MIDKETKKAISHFQRNEITEYRIYKKLASIEKSAKNKQTLSKIADDELRHYNIFKKYTGKEIAPSSYLIKKYTFLAKIAGTTFAIKLMESGEGHAQENYKKVIHKLPELKSIFADEENHERKLIALIDEERLNYIGSMVLGLNDALVELTGTIAGLTFALMKTKLVGIAALITGIAASLSMAISAYLSKKNEPGAKNPLKSSVYTGLAYILTVSVLVAPYFIFKNYLLALGITLVDAVLVILLFTYFVSVTKETNFKKDFFEMASLSLGVALISFLIGLALRYFIGVDV
jgi:VIT1/CCC1 family predicted Fe2+/Mn2+ transporter